MRGREKGRKRERVRGRKEGRFGDRERGSDGWMEGRRE